VECQHQRDAASCPLCQATRPGNATEQAAGLEGGDDTFVRDGEASAPKRALGGGSKIGRYLILDMLGSGGMGVIYTGYDPRLDRKVALKVLRGTAQKAGSKHTDGQARLLREAQAMAQLSHPNVVPVYDVGPFEDSVYVAMELVQGQTLSHWEREKKRSWREILEVFIAAGRGLEAAHLAGLVHRDFKPANVLLGADGRPRVTDFGLARSTKSDSSSGNLLRHDTALSGEDPESISEVTPSLDQPLTMKGAVMGSPGYMAPEQYAGAATSAATDQFAFCVALYEAFYGTRPFLGKNLTELAYATHQGQVPPPPKGSKVPLWIHRILVKGLSPDPAARHKSMTELLAALSHDPAKVRARVGLAVLVAAVLGGTLAASIYFAQRQAQVCRGMEQRLDGVWDAAMSARVEAAFTATGQSYAPLAFSGAKEILDKYAKAWVAARTDACEATLVRREQSERQMTLRTACLDRRREELRTLTGAFANADADLVGQAVTAAGRLSPVERCDKLKAAQDQQLSADARQSFDQLEQQIDQAKALASAGKYDAARAKLLPALDQAQKLKLLSIEAEGAQTLGELENDAHNFPEARAALERAARGALALGDDELAARCLARLISVVGWRLEDPQVGFTVAQVASGVIERLGGNELLEGEVEEGLGDSEWQSGHRNESLAHYRNARDHYLHVLAPDSLDVARIHSAIGWVLFEQGEFPEARGELEQSLAIRQKTLGDGHPELASSWNELGSLAKQQGDLDEAVADFKKGLAIDEASRGHDNRATLTQVVNIAQSLALAGKGDEAAPYLKRVLDTLANQDTPARQLGDMKWTQVLVFNAKGRYAEAVKFGRASLTESIQALGPDHPEVGWQHVGLADALAGQKQWAEALVHYERFLAIEEKLGATRDTDYAKGLIKSGGVLRSLGRAREGLERIERGERLLESPKVYAGATADAKLQLADAVWTVEGDHSRARSLALDAQQTFAQLARKDDAARAEKWLQVHAK